MMDESSSSSSPSSSHGVELPGFRFHPTEEELLDFYLRRMLAGNKLHGDIIGFLNIYKHHPTELPGLARINGEREWYFFVPRDRKHGRPNRTTENGFWKATGSDKKILTVENKIPKLVKRKASCKVSQKIIKDPLIIGILMML